jgi:NAD-dependent dihydropyrimidine dehydrogenase PreA subunit
MKRDILKIDEDLCTGCGQCVPNCHEGALQVIDGKVRLVSELMCDGLGACIGHCPEGAITIETREAEPYNATMVMDQMKNSGCPGSLAVVIDRPQNDSRTVLTDQPSELRQWPVQMHLLNPNAPYLRGSDLLLAADCVAFSMGNFHSKYLKGRSLAIACPKLDHGTDVYVEKLTAMIDNAKVNTITVMMMEVPCCGGLLQMVKNALSNASRKVPLKKMIISLSGEVLNEEWI